MDKSDSSESDRISDSPVSAKTSVYGTPRADLPSSADESVHGDASTFRNKSSLSFDSYEAALREQRAAIRERNELIKVLTDKLRATAGEQTELLKEEQCRIRTLELELSEIRSRQSFEAESRKDDTDPEMMGNCSVEMQRTMNAKLEIARRENLTLHGQIASLTNELDNCRQELTSWSSRVAAAESETRKIEDRNRGLECELSEVKTQLIWANEEHEQVKVSLRHKEGELRRMQQDIQLRTEERDEALARLEALRRYEKESSFLQKNLRQLKEELDHSQNLNKSLREQLNAHQLMTSINDSISEQTQYMEIPSSGRRDSLPSKIQDEISTIIKDWPDCGVSQNIDDVDDLLAALSSIRQFILDGRSQVEEELSDVLKEGQQVQSFHDIVSIVRTLKAYGLQGRRVPGLEEEICSLKVKLADCEAKKTSAMKEVERFRAADSHKPLVAEMERVRQETEAEMAQKIYALQSENLQLQHKRELLADQLSSRLNASASTELIDESCQTFDLLHDSSPSHCPLLIRTPQKCILDLTNNNQPDSESCQSSMVLNLEDSRDLPDSLLGEKALVLSQLSNCIDENSNQLLLKFVELVEKVANTEKLIAQNELSERIRMAQKQVEDNVEQKYLAQIEALTIKWECDKNSALHEQLLRYLHDLSEPMTVADHLVAVKALLEKELLEIRLDFSSALREDSTVNPGTNVPEDFRRFYEQLCDRIEKARLSFEEQFGSLTRAVNAARDTVVLRDDAHLKKLEAALDNEKRQSAINMNERAKLVERLKALNERLMDSTAENKRLAVQHTKMMLTLDEKTDIIDKVKSIIGGEECDIKKLPDIVQDLCVGKIDGVRYQDILMAIRNASKIGEQTKKMMLAQISNESQASCDMSTLSEFSVSRANGELLGLKQEYEELQSRLRWIEEAKKMISDMSFESEEDTSVTDGKLSECLLKLVAELRQEKSKSEELRKRLDESAVQTPESPKKSKRAQQSNTRLLSILSDVVKTCVSCDQEIIKSLEAVGIKAEDTTIPLIDEEDPLPSLGSALNVSRDEGINGAFSSNQELNELMDDAMEHPLSLQDGATDPQDDMVLVPSRRLKMSVAQMVEFVKSSQAQWSEKVSELEEKLSKNETELRDEERARNDLLDELSAAKENVITLEDARDRLQAELQTTHSQLHDTEHKLDDNVRARRRLEERVRDLEHMKFVRDRQDHLRDSTDAVKRESSEDETAFDVKKELTEENSRLENENHTLSNTCRQEISIRDERIATLERRLEDITLKRDSIEEKIQAALQEKSLQMETMERQMAQSKKFFEEVSAEKDAECVALEKEVRNLQQTLARERSRCNAQTEANHRDQLDSLGMELDKKSTDMEKMAKRRSELEIELNGAREKIDDLQDVINRLEQELTAREMNAHMSSANELRSLSPASDSVSETTDSATLQHQDLESSFKIVKEQLRAKESSLRHLEKQQALLQEVSLRLRMMAEKMLAVFTPKQVDFEGCLNADNSDEIFSPSSSLHLNQLKCFEESLDNLIEKVRSAQSVEKDLKSKVALLEKDYEDHEAEIAEYRLKNADLLMKLERQEVSRCEPSVFTNELQREIISAEKKAEGLENQLRIAEEEIRKLKDTKSYLDDRLDANVKELQQLRGKLAVYEEFIESNDDDASSESSASTPRKSVAPSRISTFMRNQKGPAGSVCKQCIWMKEMLDKQETELRRLRIEAFEKSVNDKRECSSVCSSEVSSSPDGSHQSVQLQTSFRDASLNRELQEEVLTLRSDKELLEHRKNVYESKCSKLQTEVNQLKVDIDELRNQMNSMIPSVEHSEAIRAMEESFAKKKMNALGELEVTWQDKVDQERQCHRRALSEKDEHQRELQEELAEQRRDIKNLKDTVDCKDQQLAALQASLEDRQTRIEGLESRLQRLQIDFDALKHKSEDVIKETTYKVKDAFGSKIKKLSANLETVKETLNDRESQLSSAKSIVSIFETVLQRKTDTSTIDRLREIFPQYSEIEWLVSCADCETLKDAFSEAQCQVEELRKFVSSDNSEIDELVALLHKLYWVFRRSESRRLQLLVQKSYLQNCGLRSIEAPAKGTRSLKHVVIVIMAVYRMKHRCIRWTRAALVNPDKATIISKVAPYVQNVPKSSSTLRQGHDQIFTEEFGSLL